MDDPVLAQAGVDDILGQGLLARLVLVISLLRDVVHILRSGGTHAIRPYLVQADAGNGAWVKTALEFRPCPFAARTVAGTADTFELELDTGARDTSLPEESLARLGLEPIGLRTSEAVGLVIPGGVSVGGTETPSSANAEISWPFRTRDRELSPRSIRPWIRPTHNPDGSALISRVRGGSPRHLCPALGPSPAVGQAAVGCAQSLEET